MQNLNTNKSINQYDVCIIGGGASGLTASVILAKRGFKVVILERLVKIGRKVLVSGNGKCNLMGTGNLSEKYNTDEVLKILDDKINEKIEAFFNEIGVYLKLDKNRYYPYSGQSSTVLNAFLKQITNLNIDVMTLSEVVSISGHSPFQISTSNGTKYVAKNIVLTSGS
ncbi:MAG: NAD(P)/FAD-dependent oxidoreductase, partial [Christensenellaceae bacterium]|nr:NAD(P)/FAD-dependent oxidoreductase [Christensenellaceae bacterium]